MATPTPAPAPAKQAAPWLLLAAPALLALGAAGDFDAAGMALAARAHAPLADAFFRAVTWGGSIVVLAPLALAHAAFAWRRLKDRRAFFVPLALAGATALGFVAKIAVDRARPDLAALIEMPVDASFPSAHALQVTAFAAAWLLAPGRARGRPALAESALAVLLVGLVAWSRLHLQVHYPSDILFALAAGLAWVLALRRLSFWSPRP
jgi:undecaprenyl-diphosphatase